MSDARICICTWCPTELPATKDWAQDAVEVQHHFFVAHGERVNYSVRYVFLDADMELTKMLGAS